jgi:hypothetical protein
MYDMTCSFIFHFSDFYYKKYYSKIAIYHYFLTVDCYFYVLIRNHSVYSKLVSTSLELHNVKKKCIYNFVTTENSKVLHVL